MTDGFLGRWSRRKQAVRDGESVPPLPPAPEPERPRADAPASPSTASPPSTSPAAPAAPVPQPTLADAQALTPASDFKPFMAANVSADVRNTALKKLFSDPQFNVMDRLDTYIDDYSQPDPLPVAMLRRMASARVLNLLSDEAAEPAAPAPALHREGADGAQAAGVAASTELPEPPAPEGAPTPGALPGSTDLDHAHSDLRLQPDHAPERPGAGPGAR